MTAAAVPLYWQARLSQTFFSTVPVLEPVAAPSFRAKVPPTSTWRMPAGFFTESVYSDRSRTCSGSKTVMSAIRPSSRAVSYTHLDVYKRQS